MSRTWKVAPLLLCSGACALVYQTAWFRELRLVFGGTTAASAAVLAVFMAGLGAGAALLGKRAQRAASPLGLYAALELIIAASAAASPLLIQAVRWVYVAMGGTLALGLWGGTLVRLVLSALVLAVPTLAMGGTLPAAVRAVETPEDFGRRAVGTLYGLNTLGAVTGAALSTFFLLEVYGSRNTLWLASGVNALIGLVARAAARSLPGAEPAPAQAPANDAAEPLPRRNFVLAAAAASGFAFFLLELVWYRMLGPILGGSVFTFGLILVVALAGIGVGGALYGALRRPATSRLFALTCAAEALAVAVPYALGDRLAVLAALLRPLEVGGFAALALGWVVVAAIVVFPAAVVAGFQFPTLIGLLGRGRDDVARHVGAAYAFNTGGSIAGSLLGGFVLFPLLTAPGLWRACAALLALLALLALVALWPRRPSLHTVRGAALPAALALGTLALAYGSTGPTAVWRHAAIGAGRAQLPSTSSNTLRDWSNGQRRQVYWETEGLEASLAITMSDSFSFMVNGKSDGNAIGDAPMQIGSGVLAAALHPKPTRALVVGLGTGSTAGWLAIVPTMEQVDVVEIEPAILEVARQCSAVNAGAMDNPKIKVHLGDAREMLLTDRSTYDLVASEPSNPYRIGVATLFTEEFYRAVNARLRDDGIFIQWLQTYEVDPSVVGGTYTTLAGVFPHVETWIAQPSDLLFLASRAPIPHRADELRSRLQLKPYRDAFNTAWRVDSAEGVLARFVGGDAVAAQIAKEGPWLPSTDDRTLVEFGFARSVGKADLFDPTELFLLAQALGASRPEVTGGAVDWGRVDAERALFLGVNPRLLLPNASSALRARLAVYDAWRRRAETQALQLWRQSPWEPSGPMELSILSQILAAAGDEAVMPLLQRLDAYQPTEAAFDLGRLRYRQQRFAEAADAYAKALELFHADPWPSPMATTEALTHLPALARKDPARGRQLFALLGKPFAAHAMNEKRLDLRLALAGAIDLRGLCQQAFQELEPHVHWTLEELSLRARCYELAGSKHLPQARADLEQFLDNAPNSFLLAVLGSAPPPLQAPAAEPAGAQASDATHR